MIVGKVLSFSLFVSIRSNLSDQMRSITLKWFMSMALWINREFQQIEKKL